jgi:hypothetical protein
VFQQLSLAFRTAGPEPLHYELWGERRGAVHAAPPRRLPGLAVRGACGRSDAARAPRSLAAPAPAAAAGHKALVVHQTQTSYCAVSPRRQLGLAVASLTHGLLVASFDRRAQPRQVVALLAGLRT